MRNFKFHSGHSRLKEILKEAKIPLKFINVKDSKESETRWQRERKKIQE